MDNKNTTPNLTYFKQFFDVWFQSLQVIKEKKDRCESINEGIWFIEE